MSRHIGLVACSAEGAALCYRTICSEGGEAFGKHSHPEITMHTYPLVAYMRYIEADDWEGVAELMLSSATKVAEAGADFIVCPDNTIHQAFDLVVERSPVPWLHIAAEVAAEASRHGYGRLGVMGTRFLMEGPVYASELREAGIAYLVPEDDERQEINRIIFEELVNGIFTDESRIYLTGVVSRLRDRACDAVVLGCTELPLIVTQEDSPLPILDSTRLLARSALREAAG
jgi:aspartate racemase